MASLLAVACFLVGGFAADFAPVFFDGFGVFTVTSGSGDGFDAEAVARVERVERRFGVGSSTSSFTDARFRGGILFRSFTFPSTF